MHIPRVFEKKALSSFIILASAIMVAPALVMQPKMAIKAWQGICSSVKDILAPGAEGSDYYWCRIGRRWKNSSRSNQKGRWPWWPCRFLRRFHLGFSSLFFMHTSSHIEIFAWYKTTFHFSKVHALFL